MKDATELAEKAKGVLDIDDVAEVLVNVDSQLVLDSADINIELDEITIEGVIHIVKKIFSDLASKVGHIGAESVDDCLDVLQVMLFEGLELSYCAEEVDQLANTTTEKIKLSKDLGGVEIELLSLRHRFKALLGELVGLDISIFEVLAALKNSNELVMGVLVLIPEATVFKGGGYLNLGVSQGAHLSTAL